MMKLSMLKLLMIISLLGISANGRTLDEKLISYEKNRISQNPAVEIKDLKLAFTKDVGDGWTGYLFKISLKYQGKDVQTNDVIFSNGQMVSGELKKLTGFDYKRMMHPKLDGKYFDKSHLIAGNKDAKHTLVVFSDPLCPNCTADVPNIIKDVQNNPKMFALYYISLPLDRLHPTARTLVKASYMAHEQGIKDVEYKLYTANFEKIFDPYTLKDDQVALDAFNKVFKTTITMTQVNNETLNKKLEANIKLSEDAFVNGTPTLFLDGEIDLMRSEYKKYIK